MKHLVHAIPHQSFLSIGSEVPIDKKSSFPPGEAKGAGTDSPWCILNGILRTAGNPSGAMRRPPLSGAVKLGSPMGELSSVSETEGVLFDEW